MTRREEVDAHAMIVELPNGAQCKVYGAIPRKEEPKRVYRTLDVKLRDKVWAVN